MHRYRLLLLIIGVAAIAGAALFVLKPPAPEVDEAPVTPGTEEPARAEPLQVVHANTAESARPEQDGGRLESNRRADTLAATGTGLTSVIGRVIDRDRKRPVGGAEVTLRFEGVPAIAAARTKDDGTFRFAEIEARGNATLDVTADGFAPSQSTGLALKKGQENDLGDIALSRGVPLRGRVVSTGGQAIPRAEVLLIATGSLASFRTLDFVAMMRSLFADEPAIDQTATDADGRFEFPRVGPGDYVVAVHADGFEARYGSPITVTPDAAPPVIQITLGPGTTLRGIVRTTDGLPIKGAVVATLEEPRSFPFTLKTLKTVSAADGTFAFRSLGSSDYELFCRAEGFAPAHHRIDEIKEEPLEIVLGAGARVFGRVYEQATGKGLEGAQVILVTMGDTIVEGTTRTDGEYSIAHVSSGWRGSIMVRHPPYAMATATNTRVDEHGFDAGFILDSELLPGMEVRVDVAMSAGGTVLGRVYDKDTGHGIEGAEVRLVSVALMGGGGSMPTGVSGKDGAYALKAVPPGPVAVTASKEGYVPDSKAGGMFFAEPPDQMPRLVANGTLTDINVALVKGVPIEGIVVAEDRWPVKGATVKTGSNDDFGILSTMFGGTSGRATVVTAADGRFRIAGVARGKQVPIWAEHPDYPAGGETFADTESGVDKPVEIVMRKGSTILLRLLLPDGQPAKRMKVTLTGADEPFARTVFGFRDPDSVTDEAGCLSFEAVSGKSVALILSGQDSDHIIPASDAEIALEPGKTVEKTITLMMGLTISGRVVDLAGAPVPDANIWATRALKPGVSVPWRPAQSDARGDYVIRGLSPGKYEITAQKHDAGETADPAESLRHAVATGVEAGSSGVNLVLRTPKH